MTIPKRCLLNTGLAVIICLVTNQTVMLRAVWFGPILFAHCFPVSTKIVKKQAASSTLCGKQVDLMCKMAQIAALAEQG